MKVIFLDIDGVLNVISQGHDKYGAIFHKHFEDNLRHIINETSANIVISSTWRASGLNEMQAMWKHRDLPGAVIGITPYRNEIRGCEIRQYINENNISKYVIIDDDNDMLKSQRKYFVRTSGNSDHPDCVDIGYGLTKICAEKAINILNKI